MRAAAARPVGGLAPGRGRGSRSSVDQHDDRDDERAAKVYQGVTPLVAEDVAEVIGFVASRPSHVDLDLIVVRPRDQVSGASGSRFNRK